MAKKTGKKILIILGAYLPGYKVGGPGVSVASLVEALGDEYDFRIMCADHDLGEKEPYKGVVPYKWTKVGKAKVYYVPRFTKKVTLALCRDADLVYLCGCFNDYARQVLAAKSKRKIDAPVVIAAMGLFSPGAYRISGFKKRLYMALTGIGGYYDDVSWSATDEEEAGHIAAALHCGKRDLSYHVAQDLPRIPTQGKTADKKSGAKKEKGSLSVIFLSRISEKKNLSAIAKIIGNLDENYRVKLEIYGPVEDGEYFEKCKQLLDEQGVAWTYRGTVKGNDVFKAFSKNDVFLFPTKGENFGHVISEALWAGCPVITSDRTPWKDLADGKAGFCLGLPDTEENELREWTDALKYYADMTAEEFDKVSENCVSYVESKYDIKKLSSAYRDMFEAELSG